LPNTQPPNTESSGKLPLNLFLQTRRRLHVTHRRRQSTALQGFRWRFRAALHKISGGTTSVSFDSCGAQPCPIPKNKAAQSRGKNGRRQSIALQGFRWRFRAALHKIAF